MAFYSKELNRYYASIPNCISIVRLIVIPFIIWGLCMGTENGFCVACALFVIGCLSDTLDGAVARSLGLASRVGAVLDYTADKILVITTLITLVMFDYIRDLIPILIIITRDIMVSGIREIATYQGTSITPSHLGKIKTVCQMTSIILIFAAYIIHIPIFYGRALLWISAGLAVASCLGYMRVLWKALWPAD